jgi:anti-anti-sigma factor
MPIDWSDDIVLVDFSDEPEFSEEMSALFERLRIGGGGGAGKTSGEVELNPAGDISSRRPTEPTEAAPNIVLNFGSVSYLNSSHLASLLRLRKRIAEGGGMLVLCAMNDNLRDVLHHTGLDRVFQFAPDTMTALASVQLAEERRGRR